MPAWPVTRPTHLAFAVRTDTTLAGDAWAWVQENLAQVGRALGDGVEWVTPAVARAEVLRTLTAASASAPWPTSLSTADLHRLTSASHVRLATVEKALDAQRAYSEAALTHTIGERDELAARLADAEAGLVSARSVADARGEELAVLRATATWRLHERLLRSCAGCAVAEVADPRVRTQGVQQRTGVQQSTPAFDECTAPPTWESGVACNSALACSSPRLWSSSARHGWPLPWNRAS